MRPNSLIVQHYLARAAILWIVARTLASAVVGLAGGDPVRLTVVTATMIVCATVLLSVVDVHRRHERALLENLAVSRTLLTVVFALPAIVGELGIRIVGSYRG